MCSENLHKLWGESNMNLSVFRSNLLKKKQFPTYSLDTLKYKIIDGITKHHLNRVYSLSHTQFNDSENLMNTQIMSRDRRVSEPLQELDILMVDTTPHYDIQQQQTSRKTEITVTDQLSGLGISENGCKKSLADTGHWIYSVTV